MQYVNSAPVDAGLAPRAFGTVELNLNTTYSERYSEKRVGRGGEVKRARFKQASRHIASDPGVQGRGMLSIYTRHADPPDPAVVPVRNPGRIELLTLKFLPLNISPKCIPPFLIKTYYIILYAISRKKRFFGIAN